MPSRPAALWAAALLCPALQAGVPPFSLPRLEGGVFKLSDHLGKQVIVLDFWASWCGPCSKYLKKLEAFKRKHPEVLVVTVAIDDATSQAVVHQHVKGRGYTFTVLLDPDSTVLKYFNPAGSVPTTVVIDRRGEVAYTHTGYLPGDELKLEAKVKELL